MTSKAEIDESGNLGSEDRYFVISAVVTRRFDNLRSAIKAMDEIKRKQSSKRDVMEVKFSRTHPDERMYVLNALNGCDVDIVYLVIDKTGSKQYSNLRGKKLYIAAVSELLPLIGEALRTKDVELEFDDNLLVKDEELGTMAKRLMPQSNVIGVKKVRSFANRGVQLAEFVSGAIREKYEHSEEMYFEAVFDKISLAHET